MSGMNKEKWKAMTPAQKREHIWEYYKVPIILVAFLVFMGSWFIYERSKYVEPVMKVVMTNMTNPRQDDTCFHEFLKTNGYEVYAGAVQMDQSLFFYDEPEDVQQMQATNASYETLFAIFSMSQHEIMFGAPSIYETCASQGALTDLSEVLPAELLEKHKDRLYYTDEGGFTTSYPCGVKVAGNSWIAASGFNNVGYVGIMGTTDDLEMAVNFMVYFLEHFE